MKKIIVLIVILSICYFLIGFIAVILGWFPKETYLTFSAIIGGVASVSGLLSFGIARKISNEDFENIEIGYLKKISESADQLKDKNEELLKKAKKLNDAEEEIKKLEIKKQEMEFLVKKASMTLFLEDQLDRSQKRILEIVNGEQELKRLLNKIEPIREKLTNLKEEIIIDPNVDLLEEIISSTKREARTIVELRPNFLGLSIDIKQLARTIARIMTS